MLPLKEKTEELNNPFRGFYTICRMHADSAVLEEYNVRVEEFRPPLDQSMVLLEINLLNFRDCDVSEAALANIGRAFCHFADLGLCMIVRFVYDWDGHGALSEPRQLSRILRHMEQLSPLLRQYGSHLFILQGLFIGSWGEMHNTRYASQSDLIALATKLAECSSPHTYIAVRCPNQWRTIFKTYSPLSAGEAAKGGMKARFCLFNDAITGSETDMGTYGSVTRSAATSVSDRMTRADEIAFQSRLCRYVPNGGEVLNASPLNDGKAAVRSMEAMRISYLNCNYDKAVLSKWRNARWGTGAFRKLSDYQYISAHLGYRFHLTRCELKRDGAAGGLLLRMTVVNRGFAPIYRPVNVSLLLQDEQQGSCSIPVDVDARTWLPGKSAEFTVRLNGEEIHPGKWAIGLQMVCPLTRREIRLANTPEGVVSGMLNPIGELML